MLALFEPLMRKNSSSELCEAAAQSYEIDETQTIYTFHIRPHNWSNNEKVTSHHFAKAWKHALTPGSHCLKANLFYLIKNAAQVKKGELPLEALGIYTPDENTLVVELEHPASYFLDLTATSFFAPLYDHNEVEPSCFNGPFVVSNWLRESSLTLSQNPLYWDQNSVELESIIFSFVQDPQTALAMFEKNELDLIGDPFSPLPFDAIPTFQESGNLKNKLISRMFYLLINTNEYPLNNKLVRKALSLSLDREKITEHLFFGEQPSLSLLPSPLSSLEQTELSEQIASASSLFDQALEELGLTKESFPKITFSYAQLSGQKKLAEFIQEEWKNKLGIKIEITCSEWNVHSANLKNKNYQIGTLHLTTLYPDPMFYFELYRRKDDFCNYCGWESPEFCAILEKSESAIDPAQRKLYLIEAEQLLFDEMPAIPVFTQNLQYLVQDNIDLQISDLGVYDFKQGKFLE